MNKISKETQLYQEVKPLDAKRRDRGDTFRKPEGVKSKGNEKVNLKNKKLVVSDRGDAVVNKVTIANKTIINTNKPIKDHFTEKDKKLKDLNKFAEKDKKLKLVSNALEVTEAANTSINKTSEIIAAVNKAKGDKKTTSDKMNLKPKVSSYQNTQKDAKVTVKSDLKNDAVKKQMITKSVSSVKIADLSKSDMKTESSINKREKDKETGGRKPLIKTVKTKNDKVYKAVTFTEKKIVKPTLLEIKMPNIQARKKSKLIDKNLEAKLPIMTVNNNKSTSKLSMKGKIQHNHRNRLTDRSKRKKLNRCISSPDKFKKVESPPTEVAKWGPSCINAHTKPYYEAWVNTTLAAISKLSKKDKMFIEKQNIIKSFQKSLEARLKSPELVHEDYNNEFYTGKIKIRHRNPKMKRQPLITPLLDKDFSI